MWCTPHYDPVAGIRTLWTRFPDAHASVVPRRSLSNLRQRIARHQSDIERIRIELVDELLRYIGRIEPAAVDETLHDTERHLTVGSDCSRWVIIGAVTEHLRHFAMLGVDLLGGFKLDWLI